METAVGRNETGFFVYVWRFNALAIAGAAIVLIVLGLYAVVTIFKQETRVRQVTNVVNVGDKEVSEDFTMGDPSAIEGTTYVRVPFYRGQFYSSGSFYPKSTGPNVVNYLFLNISTNESRWLLETAGQLFMSSLVVYSKIKHLRDEPRTAVGLVHTLVEKDTNGDERLTDKDALTLAVSDVDGSNYRNLIEGIERLYSVEQIADDKVLVLYQKNQQAVYELYSVPAMVRLQQSSIPRIKLK
jgi:hypothetical protein